MSHDPHSVSRRRSTDPLPSRRALHRGPAAKKAGATRRLGRACVAGALAVGLATTGWAVFTAYDAESGPDASVASRLDVAAVEAEAAAQLGGALTVSDVSSAGVLRQWDRPAWRKERARPPWLVTPRPITPPAPVQPSPEPAPVPTPEPAPEPEPTAEPAPEPAPAPEPSPAPSQPPAPRPTPAPAPVQPAPVQPAPAPTSPQAAYAADLITGVNAERAAAGLQPLAPNECARQVAQEWAEYLAASGEFKHQDMSSIASRCKFTRGVGENIALTSQGAPQMVAMWMDSPGHKANILRSSYGAIGSGVAKNSKGAWVGVHVFVGGNPG